MRKTSALILFTAAFASAFVAATSDIQVVQAKEQTIRGKCHLSVELQKTLKPTATLYVIARRSGAPVGPPLAVKRIAPPLKFPADFSLSAQDMMMAGGSFEGNLAITVRVSQSGSAMPASPGDIEGFPKAHLVPVGTSDVEIQLDQVRK